MLTIIITLLTILIISLLIFNEYKKRNNMVIEKQHCYMFTIDTIESAIYVIIDHKMDSIEIDQKKLEILSNIYKGEDLPEDIEIGVVYIGIMEK